MGFFKKNNSIPAHAVPAAHGIDETRIPQDSILSPPSKDAPNAQTSPAKAKKGNFMNKLKSKFSMMKNKKGSGSTGEEKK